MEVRVGGGVLAKTCERCAKTGRTCPSCVQRRRYAWSLVVERGETFDTAGSIMKLDTGQVRELVAAESDRRELDALRCDSIPVQHTKSVIAAALARSGSNDWRDRQVARNAPRRLRAGFSWQGAGRAAEATRKRRQRQPTDDRPRARAQ